MGIPSFYKHLIQTIPGLTSKSRTAPPACFGLDLNCAIYYCVRTLQKRMPYTAAQQTVWERALIAETIAYIRHLVGHVAPTETVLICVDGVAPVAKLKQQRARRFKSAQTAEEEARVVAEAKGIPYVAEERWDTNAITPGTAFMKALSAALADYAAAAATEDSKPRIVVQCADSAGEGEQKLMAWLRANMHSDAETVLYGLDADLIVLALLAQATHGLRVDLFREDVEFGGAIKRNTLGETQFLYLNLQHLADVLFAEFSVSRETRSEFLMDYVGIVNLLGNDFIPHGLNGREIGKSDIEELLRIRQVRMRERIIVDGAYSPSGLGTLLAAMLAERHDGEGQHILRKYVHDDRRALAACKDPVERALYLYNNAPRSWGADGALVCRTGGALGEWTLVDDWEAQYDRLALLGVNPEQAARDFLQTVAWTLAYYLGQPVDTEWYYALPNPPRIATLLAVLDAAALRVPNTVRAPLKPVEQLAMVLPASSFSLLPAELAGLDRMMPYAWPIAWPLHSFGRSLRWKCEPLLPMITPAQIRELIDQAYECA